MSKEELMKQSGPEWESRRIMQRKRTGMVWTLLKETGMKRRYIAKHLGVTIGYLNQVQYGQAPISKNLRTKIAEFLSVEERLLFSDLDRELSKGA